MNEGERKSLQQSLRETWMGALGVLTDAEAEVSRTVHRVLDTLGSRVEGDSLSAAVRELVERVKKNTAELEKRVDDGVKAAVARVHGPIAAELAVLRVRLETVQKRMEHLASRKKNGS